MENEVLVSEKNTKQYIVVKIGSEQYGFDINYVDNIVRMQNITRVPKEIGRASCKERVLRLV